MAYIPKLSLFLFILSFSIFQLYSQPRIIAHRGLWKTSGSAQNSISSLVKADSIGCYAAEFDVWQTADGILVVNHDPTINNIEIQTSPAVSVLNQKLSNGENIPTLEEYLKKASELSIRLICELKVHDSRSQEKVALLNIIDMISKFGLQDRIEYISFSKDSFKDFILNTPANTRVFYLEGDFLPSQIKDFGGSGIDYSLDVIRRNPNWINECHELGLLVNIWTVDKEEDMLWCIEKGVDFITTNEPELLGSLLKK